MLIEKRNLVSVIWCGGLENLDFPRWSTPGEHNFFQLCLRSYSFKSAHMHDKRQKSGEVMALSGQMKTQIIT